MAQYGLVQIVPPASEPVSLAEAKSWLKIEIGDDDALIAGLIAAARDFAEQLTGRALVNRTYRLSLDGFPTDGGGFLLPMPPLVSVTSVTYVDSDGDTVTLEESRYYVDTQREPGRIVPAFGKVFPYARSQANAVQVVFVAGYGTAADVPEAIKTAIKILVANWYENREQTGQGVPAAESLLLPFWVGVY